MTGAELHRRHDHLVDTSAGALNAQRGFPPSVIVPLGLRAWLAGRGIHSAVALDR